MKLISWNVNGLRAVLNKGFLDYFQQVQADIFCLQEIKLSEGQLELDLPGYHQFYHYAEKKGYSGTAIFSRTPPLRHSFGIGIPKHDREGRVICLEFETSYVLTVYTPNAKSELTRLEYRMEWEDAFRNYLKTLDKQKPVIFCGDLNVAHQEIDLTHPDNNHRSAGFTDEERSKFSELLSSGFVDTFRHFYPQRREAYTWWSYRTRSRPKNVGWRIDYFCTSERLIPHLQSADIHAQVEGSDHCPVALEIADQAIR
jgi:exodeoxyribonuclease III